MARYYSLPWHGPWNAVQTLSPRKKSNAEKALVLTKAHIEERDKRRVDRIKEAIAWKPGTLEKRRKVVVWENSYFKVLLEKPGKEMKRKGALANPNDMRPTLVSKQHGEKKAATFKDLFKELARCNPKIKKLMGTLLSDPHTWRTMSR